MKKQRVIETCLMISVATPIGTLANARVESVNNGKFSVYTYELATDLKRLTDAGALKLRADGSFQMSDGFLKDLQEKGVAREIFAAGGTVTPGSSN